MAIMTPSLLPAPSSDSNPAMAAAPKGAKLDLLRVLRMRRVLAAVVFAATLLVLVMYGLSRRPQYGASTLIYIQPLTIRSATDATAGSYDASRYDSYIQQQLLTFTRKDILAKTLDELSPRARAVIPSHDPNVAISQLASLVKAQRIPFTYQVSVSVSGSDPVAVTEIANVVTAAYLKNGQGDDQAQGNQQIQALTEERQRLEKELDEDRKEQAGLSTALGMADTSTGDTGNRYDTQLAELRGQLATARTAHQVAEAQLASVAANPAQPGNRLDGAADSLTRSDVELGSMKSSIAARRSLLISQMAGLTPANPLLQQDQRELAQLDQSLAEVTAKLNHTAGQSLKQQLQLEAARTRDVEARLSGDVAALTAQATASTPKLQRAADLAATVRRLQARFAEVDSAIRSLSISQSTQGLAHLSLAATVPSQPLPSKKRIILALAFPLAALFGVLGAVVRQKLDPRVYIGDDLTGVLSFPPMAVLPDAHEVDSKVRDEFIFRLVAGIDQAHRTRDARTFVFTAASESVRVGTLVASLSAEMHLLGYRTMTMTAAETLSAKADEIESVWEGANGLARPVMDESLLLRQGSSVTGNIERLKQNVDLLLIEALPIRSSSEAEFLARHSDVTVLVAQSGSTTRQELKSCLALLQRLGVRGVAAVLESLRLGHADTEFIESVRFAMQNESTIRTSAERLHPQPEKGRTVVTMFSGSDRRVAKDETPVASSFKN